MNIEIFNLYQEMTQLSIVTKEQTHETFEPTTLFDSYKKEVEETEYIEYLKETYGKNWYKRYQH